MNATITAELLSMYQRDGKLTAEQVLTAATDPASPLHSWFEWDDRVAAHRFRIEQASELIRRAQVDILDKRVRRFVFIPTTDSYHPVEDAMSRADWRAEMVAEFQRDADRFHARWANHKHVADNYRKWRGQPI